ncbi:MAG TPA: VUT family protein [Caldilineaceae bacterium]|nr:VUT family protein [Caldilineaceae bacterium]
MIYVALYLAAIVAANLLVAWLGPSITVANALLFVGLDLTCRDALHDRWQGRNLWLKMLLLIAAGSALSYLLNRSAGSIALASLAAFALAGVADALCYHAFRNIGWFARVNGSNLAGAAVDSLVFPTLAFGGFLPAIVAGQFVAKTLGGLLWSVALRGSHRSKVSTRNNVFVRSGL